MKLRYLMSCSILALGLCMLGACNDEEDTSFDRADLTISSGWQLDAMETNMDEVASDLIDNIDTLSQSEKENALQFVNAIAADIETVQDCERDDTYVFSDSGELMYIAGNKNCSGQGNDSFLSLPASWQLEGNTLIITDGDGDTNEAEVTTLNASTFIFELREQASEYYDELGGDIYFTITVTMEPAG